MSSMKEIMKEWRTYHKKVLKEGFFDSAYSYIKPKNQASYNNAIEVINNWKGRKGNVSRDELIEAAKWIISNDNQPYWKYAGQTGDANTLKAAAPDSIWETARNIIYKIGGGGSSSAAIQGQSPIAGGLMQLNQEAREIFKINIPFLDPSANPNNHVHPWWLTGPYKAKIGRILQSASNVFLSADSMMYLILVFLTGGAAGVVSAGSAVVDVAAKGAAEGAAEAGASQAASKVVELMAKLHKALEFESLNEKIMEILKPFLQRSLKSVVGLGVSRGVKVGLAETWDVILRKALTQASEKGTTYVVEKTHHEYERVKEEILADFDKTIQQVTQLMSGQVDLTGARGV